MIGGFGSRLASAREEAALTQEQLARRAGCSQAMVTKIESGARIPAPKLVERLAVALDLDPAGLAAAADEERPVRGASALVGAAKLGRENARRANDLKRRTKELTTTAARASEGYDAAATEARSLGVELIAVLQCVDELPEDILGLDSADGEGRDESEIGAAFARAQREYKSRAWEFFAAGAASMGAGGAAGAASGFGAYAAVASFATASTGTAIASLSGAAASSATMAWFGGGALAAGGAGIAGGTIVLASIVAVPLVTVAGGVLLLQGSQILKKQQAQDARLREAERVQANNEAAVAAFDRRVSDFRRAMVDARVKAGAARFFLMQVPEFARALESAEGLAAKSGEPVSVKFGDLLPAQQSALRRFSVVLAAVGVLLTLPVPLRLVTEKLPALVGDEASDEERDADQPLLYCGSEDENAYIDLAISRLLEEIVLA